MWLTQLSLGCWAVSRRGGIMYGHGVGSWFWVLEKVRTHHWPWLLLSVVEKNVQQILGLLVNYSVPKLLPFCWQSYALVLCCSVEKLAAYCLLHYWLLLLLRTPRSTPLQIVITDCSYMLCFLLIRIDWLFHASTEGSREETIADKIQTPGKIAITVDW